MLQKLDYGTSILLQLKLGKYPGFPDAHGNFKHATAESGSTGV